MLETSGFVGHHTAESISKRLIEVAESLDIRDRVKALTHDEAANQSAAIRQACKAAVMKHKDASWESVVCAAHQLLSCPHDALDVEGISAILRCTRKLVNHFCYSCKATRALKEGQEKDPQQTTIRNVIQDFWTRFNSSFYMLEHLLHLHVR